MVRWLAAALFVVAACAKGKDAAPPCGAVAAKFLVIAKADLDRAEQEQRADATARRAVADQLPAMRDSIAHACTESRWSAAVRKCLVDAADHVAFESCQSGLTEAQRAALAKSAAEPPASP